MSEAPYTVLSCCISLDGYLDDAAPEPLQLSNPDDFARVDELRAGADAVLVGARTIRTDDPRLLIKSAALRARRIAEGRSEHPLKVTITGDGGLDPAARFFTTGDADRVVYAAHRSVAAVRTRLGRRATVVDAGGTPSMRTVAEDLATRGVGRLVVEGGGTVLTQFLTEGVADELQLAVAPVFFGDRRGRRFVDDGRFPWSGGRRATLLESRPVGDDVVLLRYALSARCRTDEAASRSRGHDAAGG
ncbi:MAG: RibD family protein [Amnibacterium sp.]